MRTTSNTTARNVLVINGHPSMDSLCAALADAYCRGLGGAVEQRRLNLAQLDFDPLLHHGYRGEQPLEPDLVRAQNDIAWAEHLVWVYPNWWGSMPALLKGFFDRTLTPGFAFRYRKDSPMWDKLLIGKTAETLVTMDTPGWYYRWFWHRPGHHQMRHTILGFCGIKTLRVSEFGPVHHSSEQARQAWLERATELARR